MRSDCLIGGKDESSFRIAGDSGPVVEAIAGGGESFDGRFDVWEESQGLCCDGNTGDAERTFSSFVEVRGEGVIEV